MFGGEDECKIILPKWKIFLFLIRVGMYLFNFYHDSFDFWMEDGNIVLDARFID